MSKTTRLWVTIFFGLFGVHKFMDRKIGIGFLYLFTGGLFGIGWLIDVVLAFVDLYGQRPKQPNFIKFFVVGIPYYRENILQLGVENPAYNKNTAELIASGSAGKKVFQYNFTHAPVELVPEPYNPHDPNAIAVVIAGEKVGYVARDETAAVRPFLQSIRQYRVDAYISGGPYKVVSMDGYAANAEYDLKISVTISAVQ